ncbi:MAG: bifunctional pyr operon transcriptional regulator/uracil phosphoribosyltransferase PyrR [Endomicrobiales bacterium]|nr:bifunctional pyr operon transcriptional regulator/uracil phosphoribosyltransferase PyrR [Endomicrobiales bacterium]
MDRQDLVEKRVIMDKGELTRTIERLAREIVEKNSGIEGIAVIGVQTRGVFIGRRLVSEMLKGASPQGSEVPFGIVDITLYRDDVPNMETPPQVKETDISFDITGRKIILVDDVLYTGRSIRAALDELMDFGRPQNVQLAVLVDRGHRELPIEPNYVGLEYKTSESEIVEVKLEETDGEDKVVLKEKT